MADSNSRAIASHLITLLHIPSCTKTLLINNTSDPFISTNFLFWTYQLQYPENQQPASPHSLTGTVCILLLLSHYHISNRFRHDSFLIWRCGKSCIETWLCRQITALHRSSQFDATSVVIEVVKHGTCIPRNGNHAIRKVSLAARYLISNKVEHPKIGQ